jgi:uncharacterized protein YpuA (DUF1002 family)
LTIPFLIGSRSIVQPQEDLLTIEGLIDQMNSHSRPITIMFCGQIKEYVLSLLDEETNSIRKQYKNLYKEFGNLICADQSLDKITTLTELIKKLDSDYSEIIKNQTFSKNIGKWASFSDKDKSQLNEI